MKQIQNIIFDLGGVLLDIDLKRTEKAFFELGVSDFSSFFTLTKASGLFDQLEKGMDIDLFYNNFRTATGLNASDQQIMEAWNALLVGYRKKSIEQLSLLNGELNLFLLSNTNEIHLQAFQKMFLGQFNQQLDALFTEAFYSHRIGLRKPDTAAYEFVINKHHLNPQQTLFIDDLGENIKAAASIGLQTIHLLPGMVIEELGL